METYIFYEIKCRDASITDTYIGSTINFNNRKKAHKHRCNTEGKGHNNKLYTYIREHGGWDNFTMLEIDRREYANKEEAEEHEYNIIKQRNALLNLRIGELTQEEYKIRSHHYYEAHREERLKKAAEYRETNKELLRQKQQEYRDADRDLYNQKARERRAKNKDKINQRRRELRALKKKEEQDETV